MRFFILIILLVVLLVIDFPMLPSALIIFSLFIILYHSNSKKKKETNSDEGISRPENYEDKSVLDVTGNSIEIDSKAYNYKESGNFNIVPYWEHQYIYSAQTLQFESASIRRFYKKFKEEFIEGNPIDVKGNTNYAFTLMFDLLDEYDFRPNIDRLTSQMQLLVKHYPKTYNYAIDNLVSRARKAGQMSLVMEVFPEYDKWSFSDLYTNKLKLTDSERTLFDSFASNWGVMISNPEALKIKQIQLFRDVINKVGENKINSIATSFVIRDRSYDRNIGNYINRNFSTSEKVNLLKELILRLCGGNVYERYGFRSQVYVNSGSLFVLDEKIAKRQLRTFKPIVASIAGKMPDLTEEEEIDINSVYRTRWRNTHTLLVEELRSSKNVDVYIANVKKLIKHNSKNYSLDLLLFDSSKVLAGLNNIASMNMYLLYLEVHVGRLNVDKVKELPQYAQKKLFREPGQKEKFDDIVNRFLNDKIIEKAREEIESFYTPKRRRIKLDEKEINKISGQHMETVELLSAFMDDEVVEEEKVDISVIHEQNNSLLSEQQLELLDVFARNNFIVPRSDVVDFAKKNGFMANSLVDSINEVCYEVLDDVLIEEEEDNWTIFEEYFNVIIYET